MLEFLDPGSVFSQIMMQEPRPAAFLLVEGADEDRMLGDHINSRVVGIVCGSSSALLGAAVIARDQHVTNVFGLVDRDLRPELGTSASLPGNVVTTNNYDLVADLLHVVSDPVRKALNRHHGQVRTVSKARSESIEKIVFEIGCLYSAFRIVAARLSYPLRFSGFRFDRVVDGEFKPIGTEDFLGLIPISDPKFEITDGVVQEFRQGVLEHSKNSALCGGHDIASIAAGVVTRAGAKNVSKKSIETTFIAFADCERLGAIGSLAALQELAQSTAGVRLFDCFP